MNCERCSEKLTKVEIEEEFCFNCDDMTDFDLDAEIENGFMELNK
jgi:hypothetical protein